MPSPPFVYSNTSNRHKPTAARPSNENKYQTNKQTNWILKTIKYIELLSSLNANSQFANGANTRTHRFACRLICTYRAYSARIAIGVCVSYLRMSQTDMRYQLITKWQKLASEFVAISKNFIKNASNRDLEQFKWPEIVKSLTAYVPRPNAGIWSPLLSLMVGTLIAILTRNFK